MARVVIDTNVLIAGLRSRNGASFRILQLVADRQLRPLVTTALFLEYEAVLKRPEQLAAHGMSPGEVEKRLAAFAGLAEGVDIHFKLRPQLSDPKDEMVLEAAVNGRADALLTYNIQDFKSVADWFQLRIIRPVDLLEDMR
jgi:putative PIN family toxin of toxin-antitoxin system